MKNRILLSALAALLFLHAPAQKDTCKIGLYINALYDYKMDDKSFMADFWLWTIYRNDSLRFENGLEVRNAKSAEFTHYEEEQQGALIWSTQKGKAELMHQWDVSCFPFDEQKMRIEIEDAQYDATQLVYIADTVNSKIGDVSGNNEWILQSFRVRDSIQTYQTTYGNPKLEGTSSYPKIVAEITLRRASSWLLLTKMLTGAYVAFLISCLVFFLSSANQDSRFGLCVGGLFAAIGNKYIVESMISTSTSNTLMDNVHNLTFLFILLIVLITMITLNLYESGNERKVALSRKIDRYAFFSVITLFAVCNFFLILSASR
ncbi:MAG TPA: hypothetical protein VHK69_01825 [Chitinophagaceae bacterium]|jgi:hypothetical protein|nr:hypothetical protein [Chitinophagaceae bacterium]